MITVSVDINYFRAIQGSLGIDNETQFQREDAKANLAWQLLESVNCEHNATRNGVPQKLIVTKTDNIRVMNVTAFPDEDLVIGDVLEFYNAHWIVIRLYATDNIQKKGVAYQCNHKFRFQLGTSEIYERWGVIDSGVYSTTEKQGLIGSTPDQQYKLYMHKDEYTSKLSRDKRLATEIWYDIDGNQILSVYRITAYDSVSVSYIDGNLIEFKLRADQYIPSSDNIQEMICDYISPDAIEQGGVYW